MKIKILFLIESLAGGGAEKVLSVIVKHFDYKKYDVTVCPIVDIGVYSEEVKKYVTCYSPIISYRGNFLSRFWNRIKYKLVYSILPLKWVYKCFIPQGHGVEIAFCEGFVTKLLSRIDSKSRKIAWIHTDLIDNPWPVELGVYRNIEEERIAYSSYDKIVCVSQTAKDSFCKLYGNKDRTITIDNPIDADNIRKKAEHINNKNEDAIRMISVGRLVPQKGYDRLLKVVKRLYDKGYPVKLLILGEGPERSSLEEIIERNDMSSYVVLPGFAENPYLQISESDLFVCSSRAEGFSLVIAEAMVLGIPVVSTYCSGPNELLQDGKYGLLVNNSEEGLYQGIKSLLDNPDKLIQYKDMAISRGNMFGVVNAQKNIEQLLESVSNLNTK